MLQAEQLLWLTAVSWKIVEVERNVIGLKNKEAISDGRKVLE